MCEETVWEEITKYDLGSAYAVGYTVPMVKTVTLERAFLKEEHAIIYKEHMQIRWKRFKWFHHKIYLSSDVDSVLDGVEIVDKRART